MMHPGYKDSLLAQCPSYHTHIPSLEAAYDKKDGWHFCKTLAQINALLSQLTPSLKHIQFPDIKAVQDRILQESYDRLIRPNAHMLTKYIPFSNTVYGELMPPFVDRIIGLMQLTPDSLFLDLGCGVGNVITQVSLRTGCTSFGIELVPAVAELARNMMAQTLMRCAIWGMRCSHIEVEGGDMLTSKRVSELIQLADGILVNNQAFQPKRLFHTYFHHDHFDHFLYSQRRYH